MVCCFKCYNEANGVYNINSLDPSDAKFGSFRPVLDAEMKCFTTSLNRIMPDEEALFLLTGQFGRLWSAYL